MTAVAVLHPVLGVELPPVTRPVTPELRDWKWAGQSHRRRMLVRLVLATFGRRCHLCGLPGATTADHLVPWSHGGRNALENLRPAHSGCNSVRKDRPLVEWFAAHPVRPRLTPSREW